MNTKRVAAICFVLAGILLSRESSAYQYTATCHQRYPRWGAGGTPRFGTAQNTYSMPQGFDRESAYFNALEQQFQAVSVGYHQYVWPSSYAVVDSGDGYNDWAVVARSEIDGNSNGSTTIRYSNDCEWSSDYRYIIEADVVGASDLTYSVPARSGLPLTTGRGSFVHELGHALGLEHESVAAFAMMSVKSPTVGTPRPFYGGPGDPVGFLPDDTAGLRNLYPFEGILNPGNNVAVSAQAYDPMTNTIVSNLALPGVTPSQVCPTGHVKGTATFMNAGYSQQTTTVTLVVSQSQLSIDPGRTTIATANVTLNPGGYFTGTLEGNLPNVAPGTWFVWFVVDEADSILEWGGLGWPARENDNMVWTGASFTVLPSSNGLCGGGTTCSVSAPGAG